MWETALPTELQHKTKQLVLHSENIDSVISVREPSYLIKKSHHISS